MRHHGKHAPVPTVAGIKFETYFVHRIVKFLSLNIYVIYVLLSIKYWLMWFESLLVFILFKFKKKRPKISRIQVVWMNEWYIYIALYCALLYTQSALQSCGGGVSPQPPPVCSIHLDDATAATGQRRQCAHHTPATGGEERESYSQSSWWGLLGGNDWQRPVEGNWPNWLFTRSAMGFLMTTESQDLGLTSHPKDGAFVASIVSPSLYRGIKTYTDHRVSTPCWSH